MLGHFVTKTYVFEDKLTGYWSVRLVVSFCVVCTVVLNCWWGGEEVCVSCVAIIDLSSIHVLLLCMMR